MATATGIWNTFRMQFTRFARCVAAGAGLMVAATVQAQSKGSMAMQEIQFVARTSKTVPLHYLLYLPRGYDPKAETCWPLMLFLHGAGERGSDLAAVKKHGPPKRVAEGAEFPFIIVSPQCPAGRSWDNDSLVALLDSIESKYKVDRNRVYLTGLSMGGYGAWSLAVNYPERFAAVAPVCGGGNGIDVLLADGARRLALQSLPVWAFHGAKDPVVPISESERMMAAMRRAGCTNVQLTVYPEAEHDSYTETYANPKLHEWFLGHKRKT